MQPAIPDATLSTSCPQALDSRFLESSLDSLQLTQMEIDAIRNLRRPDRRGSGGGSSASTPTSQLSHPDFVDPRPDIYRFVYDISPGSRSRMSDSVSAGGAEGGDDRSAELQQAGKFDEIVVAPLERPANHRAAHRHKTRTVGSCESGEGPGETSSKPTGRTSVPLPLPISSELAASAQPLSDLEAPAALTSASVPTNEVVVSVGDALITVQQGREVMAVDDGAEMLQQPANTSAIAGSSRLLEAAASRIHKGGD